MTNSLIPVKFHDDTIFYTEKDGEMFAPMKPIVENIGLDWKSQYTKLVSAENRWGVVIITIPSKGGNQETICIPFRKLAGFLATINPDKVRPELRDKILLYQNECDDVLNEYWTTGKVESKTSRNDKKDDLEMLEYFYTKCCGATGNQAIRALDRAMSKLHGYSPLTVGEIKLPDTPDDDLYYYVTVGGDRQDVWHVRHQDESNLDWAWFADGRAKVWKGRQAQRLRVFAHGARRTTRWQTGV